MANRVIAHSALEYFSALYHSAYTVVRRTTANSTKVHCIPQVLFFTADRHMEDVYRASFLAFVMTLMF